MAHGSHAVNDGSHVEEHNYIDNQLALKAVASEVATALALKADISAMNTALALKADASALAGYVTTGDLRLTNTRTPTDGTVTLAKFAPGLIGTGAGKILGGDDPSVTDARTPIDGSVTDAKVSASAAIAKGKLSSAVQASLTKADASALLIEPVNTQNVSGTYTIPDVTSYTLHDLTMQGNTTFTFPTATKGKTFGLKLRQDGTGGRVPTLPGGIQWSGSAPTWSTAAGAQDVVSFTCWVDGVWDGSSGGSTTSLDVVSLFPNSVFASGGESVLPTIDVNSGGVSLGTGTLKLMFFTAKRSESITQLRIDIGSIAFASATLARFGVFAFNSGLSRWDLIASSVSNTTGLGSANTPFVKSLSSTWNKAAGTRYALGFLPVYGGATGNVAGNFLGITGEALISGTRTVGNINSLGDLPSSFVEGDISSTANMAQLIALP